VVELPFPAAVKTGTTTDWRDNWTIGYSTERLVGVWVGNADNTPMLDVSGIDGAGPIWRDLMLAAHPTPPMAFMRPADIDETTICALSGLLPSQHCPRTRRERFIHGTVPTLADNQFQPRPIDLATQMPATDDTPTERIAERVYWMLPPKYHDWMVSQGIPLAPPDPCPPDADCGRLHIVDTSANVINNLVLHEPTSNTAYQIHPGMPRANQRIAIGGYTGDGQTWVALRLVKDGTVLTENAVVARLNSWWVLEPGQHQFWLEGKPTEETEWVASERAFVTVETFVADQATASN